MATSKSYFELLLSESYANSLHKNNLKVRTDCLRQSVKINSNSNKNKFECKNCGCTDFYDPDYQIFSFKILPSL